MFGYVTIAFIGSAIKCIFNPLYTEWTPPNYILEESDFNFRYVELCDLDIPRENWLNYLQTVETLIRCCRSESALFANYPFRVLHTTMG